MKKILSYVFLFCLTLCVLVSCKSVDASNLIKTLLVEQDSYVDADFYVVGEIKSGDEVYPLTWESDNACLAVSESRNEAGYYTIKVTRPETEAQTIKLTATLSISKKNTASKSFEFRVYPIDVYDILDNFNFEHKGVKVEMGSTIELPLTATYKEKTATIAWSTEDTDVVTLNEAGSQATFATVVRDTPVTLTATLSYNGKETSMNYSLTVAPYATEFEKLKEWYEGEGLTQVLSGYVVEIATVYSESYQNVSLYIVNDSFTGGYYLYRVKMTVEEAAQLKIGAHVTATGTVNTSYSGLMETNAGGNLVVDEEIDAIDAETTRYAIDNDLIANVNTLYYRTSTLVSLSNWKVKEVIKEFDTGSTGKILKLEKDGVVTTVCYSNYMASTPMPNKNGGEQSQAYKDVLAKLDTLAVGDYVNVTGLLSYYNTNKTKYDQESYQIYVQGADSIVKIADGADVTGTDAKKMAAAIALFEGFKPAYTSNGTIELPATLGDATVTWAFHNKYHSGAEFNAENTALTITPSGYSVVSLDATYTVGSYSTTVYYSFVVEKLTDAEIVDRVLAEVELEEQYSSAEIVLPESHELYGGVTYTYALKETYKSTTLEGNKLTVDNLSLDAAETVVVIVTVTVGETSKSIEVEMLVHVLTPSTIAEFLAAKNSTTPTLLQGVVTAVNGVDQADSFVLTDAEGTSVFCYDKKLTLTLGDEIQILAYYGENNGFQQLSQPQLVKTVSTGNDVTVKSGTKVELTAAQVLEAVTAEGVTESKIYKEFGAQYLAIRGYVVLSGSYTYLATAPDAAGCVSLYANKGLNASSYVGGEVIIYGFARGCSLNGKYLTIQVQSIGLIENDENKVAVELSGVKFEEQYDAGEVTLPVATKYADVQLTYTVKSGAENASIADGKLTLVASAQNATVVITVTATLGETTVSKDVTLVVKGTAAVEVISTVAEFLAAKNADTSTLLKGVITAVNKVGEKGAFVLTDAEGTSIFCYSGLNVALGDEVKISAKYSENQGFAQIGSPELLETISTGNDVAAKSGTKVEINATDLVAKLAEDGMTNAGMYELYGTDYLAIKGYVIANGSYNNLSATKDGSSCVNLYANSGLGLSDYVGKEVIIYGFARGANVGSKYLTVQVQAIEEVTASEPETPVEPDPTPDPEPEVPTLQAKTVAEFLAAKDADNAVLLQGVVTAVNKVGSAGSFVLTDAEGTSVFCYTSVEVTLGDEIKLSAKYSENQGFAQIGSPEVLEVVSTGNDVAAKSGTKVEINASDLVAKLAEDGMTNAGMYELYGTDYLAIRGYVIASGNYANLSATVDGSSCVNLYANATLNSSSYIGKEVIIYGFARGANVGSKYLTVQVQAIEEVTASEPETPVEPDPTPDPEPEVPGITYTSIEEANAIGAAKAHNTYTEEKYYVKGIVTSITNTQYGNLYISDGTNQILVYGLYSADGETGYSSLAVKPVVGDEIVVYGVLGQYNSSPQMKNAWLTEIVLPTDEVKAQRVLDKVMDLFVASKYTQIAIFTFETMYEGVTIEVQLPENAQTLAWNAENKTLTVTPLQTEVAESVTIKVLINEVTLTSDPVEFVSQIVAVEAAIYDFVTNFSSYGSGWSSSYTTHTVTSAELGANLPQAKVDFTRANKQSSTITTMPVVAPKASTEYVTITLEDTTKTIKSAVFELAQWNTKTFTDIHLEYYNGSSWVTCSANVTTPGKLESTELPEGVTQVRLAVQITANSNTQLGLKSITLTF